MRLSGQDNCPERGEDYDRREPEEPVPERGPQLELPLLRCSPEREFCRPRQLAALPEARSFTQGPGGRALFPPARVRLYRVLSRSAGRVRRSLRDLRGRRVRLFCILLGVVAGACTPLRRRRERALRPRQEQLRYRNRK